MTHTTHSDNLEDSMSELTIKDKLETILDTCIFTALDAEMHSTATSVASNQIMQLIDSAITEARINELELGVASNEYNGMQAASIINIAPDYADHRIQELKNNTTKQEDKDV